MTLRTLISLTYFPYFCSSRNSPYVFLQHKELQGWLVCLFFSLMPCIFFLNSGNKEITWMMLEAGAETDVVNSVGRTAAQMAAFVGKVKVCYDFLNS